MWGFLIFCIVFYWVAWPRIKPCFKNQIVWLTYMRDNAPPGYGPVWNGKHLHWEKTRLNLNATSPQRHKYDDNAHIYHRKYDDFNPNHVPRRRVLKEEDPITPAAGPLPKGERVVFINPSPLLNLLKEEPVFSVLVKSQGVYRVPAGMLTQHLIENQMPVPRCLVEWIPDNVMCNISDKLIKTCNIQKNPKNQKNHIKEETLETNVGPTKN